MKIYEEAEEALEMAKMGAMLNPSLRFMSEVMLRLAHRISDVPSTARTDGFTCEYNPDFLLKLTAGSYGSRVGLLTHETFHPALQHFVRQEYRNAEIWNISSDEEGNHLIKSENIALPEGGCCTPKYKGWSAEDIYDDMVQGGCCEDQPENPTDVGDMVELGSLTEGREGATKQDATAHINEILAVAAIRAEDKGYSEQVPPYIKEYLKKLNNPTIPWLRVMRTHMTRLTRSGYSYRAHNRRYLPDFYLPKFASESLDEVLIGHDTSGSVTTSQHRADLTEMWGMVKMAKPKKVIYAQWGSEVVDNRILKRPKDFEAIDLVHGGGTKPQRLFDWAEENTKTKLAIIFTDGQFNQNVLTEPPFLILWVVYNNPDWKPPFGKAITYTRKETND
jgi:predicted metal-dependent peptidase